MMNLSKVAWWLSIVLLVSGCGPSYRTFVNYIPPTDSEGRNCALHCDAQRQVCDSECRVHYEGCVKQANLAAKADYLNAKERYLNEKSSCMQYAPKSEKKCAGISEPSLNNYIDNTHCRQNCGCESNFERCFQLCGGTIERDTHCVNGC